MSFDLGVWFPHRRLSDKEADKLYSSLCRGAWEHVEAHLAVEAFYQELTARYPEIDTVPDDLIDEHDYCPWSCALDYSPGHVIMPCIWPKAQDVERLVSALALKHGLAVYNPQSGRITYPDTPSSNSGKRPWWRFW